MSPYTYSFVSVVHAAQRFLYAKNAVRASTTFSVWFFAQKCRNLQRARAELEMACAQYRAEFRGV